MGFSLKRHGFWWLAASVLASLVVVAVPSTANAASKGSYNVLLRQSADVGEVISSLGLTDSQVSFAFDGKDGAIVGFSATLSSSHVAQLLTRSDVVSVEADDQVSIDAIVEDEAQSTDRYIVEMKANSSAFSLSEVQQIIGQGRIATFDEAIVGYVANLSVTQVQQLRARADVIGVEIDQPIFPTNVQQDPTWGIDRIDQQNLPRDNQYAYSNTADDVTVYVLDTGVDASHSEFGGRVASGYSAFVNESATQDCASGHGTHVAGTIAGAEYGVAKNATIVPVKVLSCVASSYVSHAISGINWIIANHTPGTKAVANLSLSTGVSSQLNSAITSLFNAGVIVAVAASNNNADACNYSPASAPVALTVGASTVGDTKASFSNYGSCVDLFAPGYLIVSAKPGGGSQSMSGTSMASPHVAGAAAVLWHDRPTFTHSQIADLITSSATPNKVTHSGTTTTYPLLHVPTSNESSSTSPPEDVVMTAQSNDNFVNAHLLNDTNGSLQHDNTTATREVGEPSQVAGNGGRSLWYSFSNASDGSLTVDLSGSDFDTVLEVFTGSSLSSLRLVAVSDDAASPPSLTSKVVLNTTGNVTYWIRLSGYSSLDRGAVALSWSFGALVGSPSSPQMVKAFPRASSAVVYWAPPSTGVTPTISYTVTTSPGNAACTVVAQTHCEVTGLSTGQSYTFTVRATNSIGISVASSPSAAITLTSQSGAERSVQSWGLDRIDQRELPLDSTLATGNKGSGVRVYVVDTGVYADHADFTGRVTTGADFVGDGLQPEDCDASFVSKAVHGTHVASTAAGSTHGIATEAIIVPVRVLNCAGSGSESAIVAGLDWIRSDLRTGTLAVVNMSLGFQGSSSMITAATNSLINAGATVVVAAGNDTMNACYFSPASITAAFTVASSTSADTLSSFSNYGSCVDIIAPGSSIRGAGITGTTSVATMSGTSMAAPHVAGFAAVVAREIGTSQATQVTQKILSLSTVDVFASLPTGTPNRLLYVPATACEINGGTKTECDGSSSGQPAPETPLPETPLPETPAPTPLPTPTPAPVVETPIAQQPTTQNPTQIVTTPSVVRTTLTVTNRKRVSLRTVVRRASTTLGDSQDLTAIVRRNSRNVCSIQSGVVKFTRSGTCVLSARSSSSSVRAVIKLSVRR